jgi:hypothetical protein
MIGMRLKSEIAQQTLSDRNASYAACLVCGMLRMRHASHAACFACLAETVGTLSAECI